MASQTLETLRPAIKSPRLIPTSTHFEMTSSENDRVTNFIFEAEIYLKYFFNSKCIQEIILIVLSQNLIIGLESEIVMNIVLSYYFLNLTIKTI